MDETKPESNVVDFSAKRAENINLTEKVKNLIAQDKVTEAINELPANIPVQTLEYLYNKALEFFNNGKIENAKTIFLKIVTIEVPPCEPTGAFDKFVDELIDEYLNAEGIETSKITNTKNNLTNDKIRHYVYNSNFNLGIIYTMENDPDFGKLYCCSFKLKDDSVQQKIQDLLAVYNDYQKFKTEFQTLNENLNTREMENLNKCFFVIYKDIMKEVKENYIFIKSFTKKHLLLLEKIIGKGKLADQKLLTRIEEMAYEFIHTLGLTSVILLGNGSLELNFLEQFQFDKIDLDKSQDYYVDQLQIYLKQKILEVRKDKSYITTKDEYNADVFLFSQVEEKIETEHASDLEILYAFLKNSIFYSNSFLVSAIIKLMKTYNQNISFPESIKEKLNKVLNKN